MISKTGEIPVESAELFDVQKLEEEEVVKEVPKEVKKDN